MKNLEEHGSVHVRNKYAFIGVSPPGWCHPGQYAPPSDVTVTHCMPIARSYDITKCVNNDVSTAGI